MAVRMLFGCEFCGARPDPETQRSLQRHVRDPGSAALVDALPGNWLIWRGGGALGPRRYACAQHRGELAAYLRLHYAAISSGAWHRPPYPRVCPGTPPDGGRVGRGGGSSPQAGSFLALARAARPGLDQLLLALAAEFGPVDHGPANERLDEFSRSLFGLHGLHPEGQAGCVSHALRHEHQVQPTGLEDPQDLLFDRVLERRRGHPVLLAAVAVEIARRAGVQAAVCSSPGRWFAAFGDEDLALVELAVAGGSAPAPSMLRRHCAHEVAFGVVQALCASYTRAHDRDTEARRAFTLGCTLHAAHSTH